MGKTAQRKAAGNVQVIAAANEAKRDHYATLLERFCGNHLGAQTVRLCHALKTAPVTSYEAKKYLNVSDVPARVKELRAHGYQIQTMRVAQETEAGFLQHRVSLYVLQSVSSRLLQDE